MKKLIVVVALSVAFLAASIPVSAQCFPGRIGGCPSNIVANTMANTLSYTYGGGLGYGYYGYNWKGVVAATVPNMVASMYAAKQQRLMTETMAREQTNQVRAMANAAQPQLVQQSSVLPPPPTMRPLPFAGQETLPVYRENDPSALPIQPVEWVLENLTNMPIVVSLNGRDIAWLLAGEIQKKILPMNKETRWMGFAFKASQSRRDQVFMQKVPLDVQGEGLYLRFVMPELDRK